MDSLLSTIAAMHPLHYLACLFPLTVSLALVPAMLPLPHGTVVSPLSRVYRVYQSNPENPNFQLAANAVQMDGTSSYYTWNELSRNIPEAVRAGLPPGFDYSPWIQDGQLASAGRVDKQKFARTYAGLDQPSAAWPTTPVTAGQTFHIDFLATAPHNPSVWDVWMTTPDWDASSPLAWNKMQLNNHRFSVITAASTPASSISSTWAGSRKRVAYSR